MSVAKSEKIHMYWYKVPFGKKNFGDVLGPYLVEKLTGKEAIYTPLRHVGFNKEAILNYLRNIYNRNLSARDLYYNLRFIFGKKQNLLITIGSVMDLYSHPNCDIWGSGIMYRNNQIYNANFCAVRGKHSQIRLGEFGYKVPEAIGDPALLTPLIYTPATAKKKYKLGIIPHFLHYEEIIKKLDSDDILIINLLDDIEKVIDDVCACEKIVSSSLHGIIIAHAYGVPALWIWLSKGKIGGDDIKFADYFSSVNIDEYQYFNIDTERYDQSYLEAAEAIFDANAHLTVVDPKQLRKLQLGLIEAAPFEILPEYKNLK